MESDFIAWLRQRLRPSPHLRLGPGDDAAILRLGQRADCVITSDLLTDTVDFELGRVAPRRIGHKALAVNLSDLAAMASVPLAVVVSLVLPRSGGGPLARELYEGMIPLAEKYQVDIAGGDTNSWDGPLAICITAIGKTTQRPPLKRSGARPGDVVIVTGSFGGSILGKHLDFTPRVEEALLLNDRYELHAGIDVSDGLSLDLSRICTESECGATVNLETIPLAPAAEELSQAHDTEATALDHALSDGEDFELILAVPPQQAQQMLKDQPLSVPLTAIGVFQKETGLWQKDSAGKSQPLIPQGYEHRLDE